MTARPSSRQVREPACPAAELLPAIEAELAASDLAAAYRLAVQVPDPLARAVRAADRALAAFSLRAFEAAAYFDCASTAMRAERMATSSLRALPEHDELVERLGFGLAVLRSECARLSGRLDWMVRATGQVTRQALSTVHRRTDFERYQACWEVVELLASLGQHRRAADLARRMHDFASSRLGEVEAVESGILVHLCAADLEGLFSRRLDAAPPRFEDTILGLREPLRAASRSTDALRSLASRARALGRENWALRAEQHVHALVFEHTGDPEPFAAATRALQQLGARRGIRYLERAQQAHAEWARLAGRSPGTADPSDGEPVAAPGAVGASLSQPRRLYREACAAKLAGQTERAWSLYAAYLRQHGSWPWREWLSKADDLHGAGEVLVALPRASRRTRPPSADCLGLVQGAIREARKSGNPASVADVAEALQVTPRRIQQAFKAVGLPSPGRYLKAGGSP